MLATLGIDERRRALRRHPGGAARQPARPAAAGARARARRSPRRPGRPQPDRPRVVPGRRRLPPLDARRRSTSSSCAASGTRPTRRTSPRSARARSRASTSTSRCIAELVGLDVVSASHYDGAAATAEAALMTCRATRRERVLVVARRPSALPRRPLETYFGGGLELDEIPLVADGEAAGTTDLAALERLLAERGPAGRRRPRRAAELPRAARADGRDRPSWPTRPARCSSPSSSRSRWPCSRRPARTARTSRPARASRSASRRSTAGRTSASSPRPMRSSARSPAASSA